LPSLPEESSHGENRGFSPFPSWPVGRKSVENRDLFWWPGRVFPGPGSPRPGRVPEHADGPRSMSAHGLTRWYCPSSQKCYEARVFKDRCAKRPATMDDHAPPRDLTQALAALWQLAPPRPNHLFNAPAFVRLRETCQSLYPRAGSGAALSFAIDNALQSAGLLCAL
jgi:hypothetical protein